MEYNYEEVRGGKGNPPIVRFVRGTQEQFDKMIDKTNMIKPDLYMKDNTIYFVVPDNTKPVKVAFDNNDKPDSIEENPFLQESIDF